MSKDAIDAESKSAQKVIAKIEKEQAAKKETDATKTVTDTAGTKTPAANPASVKQADAQAATASTKPVKMPKNRVDFQNSVTDTFPGEFQARTYSTEGQNITFQLRGVDGTSHGTVIATGLDGKSVFVANSKGNVVRVAGKDLQTVKVDMAATEAATTDASGALGTFDGKLNGKGSIGQFRSAPDVSFKVGDVEHEGQLVGLAADGKNFVVRGNDNKFYSLDKSAIESKKAQKVMAKIEDEQILHAKATQSAEDVAKPQEELAARKKAEEARKASETAALKQRSDDAARLAEISKPQMKWKDPSISNTFRTEFDANSVTKTGITFTKDGVTQEGTYLGKGIDGKSAYALDNQGKPVFLNEKELQTVAPSSTAAKAPTTVGNSVGVYEGRVRGQGVAFSNPVDFTINGVEHEGQLAGFAADGKNFLARGNDNEFFVISKDQITSPSAKKIAAQYEKDQALRAGANATVDTTAAAAKPKMTAEQVKQYLEDQKNKQTSPRVPAGSTVTDPASGMNPNVRNKKPSVRTPNQEPDDSTAASAKKPNELEITSTSGDVQRSPTSVSISNNSSGSFSGENPSGRYSVVTDTGVGYGKKNEDAVLVTKNKIGGDIYVSVDGMGGHGDGEVASHVIVNHINSQLAQGKTLDEALNSTNQALKIAVANKEGNKAMGAVLASVEINGDTATFRHAGDAKALVVRNNQLVFESEDHSFANSMMKLQRENILKDNPHISDADLQKKLTKAARDIRNGPLAQMVNRAYGATQQTAHETNVVKLLKNDRVVLASDGLWDNLSQAEVNQIVSQAKTPEEATQKLKDAAMQRMEDTISRDPSRTPARVPGTLDPDLTRGKPDNLNIMVIFH